MDEQKNLSPANRTSDISQTYIEGGNFNTRTRNILLDMLVLITRFSFFLIEKNFYKLLEKKLNVLCP